LNIKETSTERVQTFEYTSQKLQNTREKRERERAQKTNNPSKVYICNLSVTITPWPHQFALRKYTCSTVVGKLNIMYSVF